MLKSFFASNLYIELKKNKNSFVGWKALTYKDSWEEVYEFQKGQIFIKFAEDLREHSIVMTLKYDHNIILKVGYSDILVNNGLDVSVLQKKLKELPKKQRDIFEIQLYLSFLKDQKILEQ